jgi:hypothetical protein
MASSEDRTIRMRRIPGTRRSLPAATMRITEDGETRKISDASKAVRT